MNYKVLAACSSKPGRTDVLHTSLFHGLAEREDVSFPNSPTHFLGDNLESPLLIDMGGTLIPDVFLPGGSLVLSSAAQSALGDISGTCFSSVVFRKLVNYRYQAGDFGYYHSKAFLKDPYGQRSDEILSRLPDDPSLHPTPNLFRELVLPNMYRITPRDDRVKCATINLRYLAVNQTEFVYHSLDKYPIFWSSAIFFRHDVFSRIDHLIDWDYFTSGDVDL